MAARFANIPTHTVNRSNVLIPKLLTAVKPSDLKNIIDTEAQSQPSGRAKIRFIDCQGKLDNSTKKFNGAIHMDLKDGKNAPQKFQAVIGSVPNMFKDLATADLVIFYCILGADRSPKVMYSYELAVKGRQDRNPAQKVLLLDGGMSEYMKLSKPTGIKDWVSVDHGKVVASSYVGTMGPKLGTAAKVQQSGGEADVVIYTEP